MPQFKTALWLAAAFPLVLAAPAPQIAPGGTPTAHLVPVTYTVDCGCWNMCTLEKLITPDLVCGPACDPEFLCESPVIKVGSPSLPVVLHKTKVAKRDIPLPKVPMPFNPFGPGVLHDEPIAEEKRSEDSDSKWPWDTPDESIPPPLARKSLTETVPKWPPPFVNEESLEQSTNLVERAGSLSTSATKKCTSGKCEVQVTVTATWTF